MNKYQIISFLFFIIGVIFFIFGIIEGDVEFGFFLIFPFLIGSGLYAVLGFFFVFIAIFLFIFNYISKGFIQLTNDEDTYDIQRTL